MWQELAQQRATMVLRDEEKLLELFQSAVAEWRWHEQACGRADLTETNQYDPHHAVDFSQVTLEITKNSHSSLLRSL
jgi:hypothetical protein